MSIYRYLTIISMLVCQPVSAQIMERSYGAFNVKMGTSPIRSMAQGLVTPTGGSGSFHGGFDLTHESGLYFGQWTPSFGVVSDATLEVDNYLGFKKPFDNTLGYEMGVIRYSHPEAKQLDSYEFYGGLRMLDKKIGTAFSSDLGRSVSTVFVDVGALEPLGLGLRMQYATHRFTTPQVGNDGNRINGFSDWSVNLSRSLLGVEMNLVYSGSTLDAGTCNVYSGHNERCQQIFNFKVARSFF